MPLALAGFVRELGEFVGHAKHFDANDWEAALKVAGPNCDDMERFVSSSPMLAHRQHYPVFHHCLAPQVASIRGKEG